MQGENEPKIKKISGHNGTHVMGMHQPISDYYLAAFVCNLRIYTLQKEKSVCLGTRSRSGFGSQRTLGSKEPRQAPTAKQVPEANPIFHMQCCAPIQEKYFSRSVLFTYTKKELTHSEFCFYTKKSA